MFQRSNIFKRFNLKKNCSYLHEDKIFIVNYIILCIRSYILKRKLFIPVLSIFHQITSASKVIKAL